MKLFESPYKNNPDYEVDNSLLYLIGILACVLGYMFAASIFDYNTTIASNDGPLGAMVADQNTLTLSNCTDFSIIETWACWLTAASYILILLCICIGWWTKGRYQLKATKTWSK